MPMKFPLRLTPQIKNNLWGKEGRDSYIARLLNLKEEIPYAELWVELKEKLPLLLKILSVGDALSIQAHPNSEQAQILLQRDPANYPDAAAKPEASVALSEVELLYGFRSAEQIRNALAIYPELAAMLSEAQLHAIRSQALDGKELIAAVFTAVIQSNPEQLDAQQRRLIERLKSQFPAVSRVEWWISSLYEKYPADPGLFCFLLLNHVTMEPGQSIYIAPGVVHAYLSGDLIEVMNFSDTVVRAGLTAKHRDINSLLEIVNYEQSSAELIVPSKDLMGWTNYDYPEDQFSLGILNPTKAFVQRINKPQLWLCLEHSTGKAIVDGRYFEFLPGLAYFMPPDLGLIETELRSGKIVRATIP